MFARFVAITAVALVLLNVAPQRANRTSSHPHLGQTGPPASLADIIALCEQSVVRIETTSGEGNGIGSGFIVDDQGTIITNCHVLAGATTAKAHFSDGQSCDITGTMLIDEARDIVVAKLTIKNRPELKLAADLPRKGEAVVALGAPHGLAFTATRGIVSAIREAAEMASELGESSLKGTWVQVDAALSPGNSGGPLVDEKGQVVAMSTLASQGSAQNLNFGISALDIAQARAQSRGRATVTLRDGVARIRSKQSPNGGPMDGLPRLPEPKIQEYLDACKQSFSTLTRELRIELVELTDVLKEMKKGETLIPAALARQAQDAGVVRYMTPQGRAMWFFRDASIKERQIDRIQARVQNLTQVRSQTRSPNDPASLLQLAMNFGPKLDARQNQSIGFLKEALVLNAFNDHEVAIVIDEVVYIIWLESTAGLSLGEQILPCPVFVDGTATLEVPQRASQSVTLLRQVSEQEIRSVLEFEEESPPSSSTSESMESADHQAEFRNWSDKTGKFSTEAQLVSRDNATVKLKRRDGKVLEVPISALSADDQQFLKSR